MGYFTSERKIERVKLKTNPEYWVDIYADIKWGEQKKFISANEDGKVDMMASADAFLLALIVDWNLDDESGNKVPITAASIDLLDGEDALILVNAAGAAVKDDAAAKKN